MPESMVNILDITIHIECQNQEATSLPLCLSDFLYSIHASIHMHSHTRTHYNDSESEKKNGRSLLSSHFSIDT